MSAGVLLVGVSLALLTSVCWALGNVFIHKSGKAVGAPRAMLWALLAGGALAGVLSLAFDTRTRPVTVELVGWIAVAGGAGLVAYVCLFLAFERAPLSIAVPLVSCWSVVACAFSLVVLGERPSTRQLVGAGVVIAGVILVSIGPVRQGRGSRQADPSPAAGRRNLQWAALGSALGFGVMVPVMTARVAPALGAFGGTALVYVLGVILALPLAAARHVSLRPPPRASWALVLGTGCFETLGFVSIAVAQRFAPTTVVAPVSSLAAALTIVYAWVVLRERPELVATVGAVLACVGIVVLSS